jgi:KaiC/GvpD/RAD55 family RecA-like ATPase
VETGRSRSDPRRQSTPELPTILTCTDGVGLWYPGRTHALVGESEAAKSWIAQYACAQQIIAGQSVIYLDFEDSPEAVADRMIMLGITAELLRNRFGYIAPEEPIEPSGRTELAQALGDLRPALVITDGMTEANVATQAQEP